MLAFAIGMSAGCGGDDDGGDADGTSATDPEIVGVELAESEYLVAPGDTLWQIATDSCGDPWAYIDIFNDNAGLLQDNGRALVDPSRIDVGWILLVNCPAQEELEFQEAPPDETVDVPSVSIPESSDPPSTSDPPPPAAIQFAPVPSNTIAVSGDADDAGGRPASAVVSTSCLGTTTLPVIQSPKAVLRSGETAEKRVVYYGQTFGITVEGMAGAVSARLLDEHGSSLPLEPRPGGFLDIFIDPGLPSGDYVVEASSPSSESGFVRVEIRAPDEPDLLRETNDDPIDFLLTGGSGAAAHLYREQVEGCTVSWEYWHDLGALAVNADGNGRVSISIAGSHPGEYCLTFDTNDNIKAQCLFGKKQFVVE